MDDPSKIYNARGKSLSSIDVSSFILEQLVKSASEALGQKIRDVVITVPAYFTEAQKEDTKKAGERVGLNVLRIIPEPTAVAIITVAYCAALTALVFIATTVLGDCTTSLLLLHR